MEEGQVFIANGWKKRDELCESAWQTMSPFVMALAHGADEFLQRIDDEFEIGNNFLNERLRPVSFLLETLEEAEE